MAMGWLRQVRAKELRRMDKSAANVNTRQAQFSRDLRNVSNGTFTSAAKQLSRLDDRPCAATYGAPAGNCSTAG